MSDYQFIRYERQHAVVTVTLNRPEASNALHAAATDELARAWAEFADDPRARVAILTGSGEKAFCAGLDLRSSGSPAPSASAPAGPHPAGFGGLTNPAYRQVWKPIICAMNGVALGGGLELALACDIIVAANHVRLGLPEPLRGIMPGAGGHHRLARTIPLKIAMGLLLTGGTLTAAEAARWGLVNEVVARTELMPAARRWATAILECAPLAIQAIKQATLEGLGLPLAEAYAADAALRQAVRSSADSREGRLAFVEKRAPIWRGE